MKRSFLFLSLFSFFLRADDSPLRPSTTGFYPLWENTAFVENGGDAFFGTYSGHVGVANRLQIGLAPIHFAYRTPNLYLKGFVWGNDSFYIGAQAGVYHLLERASRSSMSPDYTSRLDNPDFTVTLFPLSLPTTLRPFEWLDLHQTVTGLVITSTGPIQKEVTWSYSLVAELLPLNRHALLLHWTDVGLWAHDNTIVGASYRYRNTWMEFKLGYFYRFRKTGNQSSPLVGIGFLL